MKRTEQATEPSIDGRLIALKCARYYSRRATCTLWKRGGHESRALLRVAPEILYAEQRLKNEACPSKHPEDL